MSLCCYINYGYISIKFPNVLNDSIETLSCVKRNKDGNVVKAHLTRRRGSPFNCVLSKQLFAALRPVSLCSKKSFRANSTVAYATVDKREKSPSFVYRYPTSNAQQHSFQVCFASPPIWWSSATRKPG